MGLFSKKNKSKTVMTDMTRPAMPETEKSLDYPVSQRPVVFHGPRGISENTLLQKTAELEAELARHKEEKKQYTFRIPEAKPVDAEKIVGEYERQRNEKYAHTEWAKIKQADLQGIDVKITQMYDEYQYLAQEDHAPVCTMNDISEYEIEKQTQSFSFDAVATQPEFPGDIPALTERQQQEIERILAQGIAAPKEQEIVNEIPELTEEMLAKLKSISEEGNPA